MITKDSVLLQVNNQRGKHVCGAGIFFQQRAVVSITSKSTADVQVHYSAGYSQVTGVWAAGGQCQINWRHWIWELKAGVNRINTDICCVNIWNENDKSKPTLDYDLDFTYPLLFSPSHYCSIISTVIVFYIFQYQRVILAKKISSYFIAVKQYWLFIITDFTNIITGIKLPEKVSLFVKYNRFLYI